MQDLIQALELALKYDKRAATHCEHDVLYIVMDNSSVSPEDEALFDKLSFNKSDDGYESFRFGSC